jgi:hypothetical protein
MIGNAIYEQIEKIVGSDGAPKITGMIIDLNEDELIRAVSSLENLTLKARDANALLQQLQIQQERSQMISQPVVSGVVHPGSHTK